MIILYYKSAKIDRPIENGLKRGSTDMNWDFFQPTRIRNCALGEAASKVDHSGWVPFCEGYDTYGVTRLNAPRGVFEIHSYKLIELGPGILK